MFTKAKSAANPNAPSELTWSGGERLIELPPLTWAGRFRLPASGWCGRLAAPRWILRAARESLRSGRLPLLVVHPWELVDRPVPGMYTGLARLFHDAGRSGYRLRFRELLAGRLHSRVPATLLIAIGAFFPTLTDSLNRAGSTDLYQLGKFLGVLFLFAGFLVSVEVFREVRIPFTSIRLGQV